MTAQSTQHPGLDRAAVPSTLVGAFTEAAAANPDGAALADADQVFTYRQLDAWSDAVGELLHTRGVRRGDWVALRLPASAEAIAAMLGILKAGAAYVPLDMRNPSARNQFIVEDARTTAFIGDPDGCAVNDAAVIDEEDVAKLWQARPQPRTEPVPAPEDDAYVIYTSGTTGRPKGVPVTHGNAAALLAATSGLFSFSSADRWLLFHSIAFDFSVWEIWGALSTGARLVVVPQWTARKPEECARFVRDQRITVLNQTPTAFTALATAVLHHDIALPHLRYIIFCGEKLTPAALRPWADRFGLKQPALVNTYGITETTVLTTFHEMTEKDLAQEASPIGRPLPGFTARVVTEDGRDAAPGEEGELWLAGPQVVEGYLNLPDLTARRFPLLTGPQGSAVRHYRSGDLVSTGPDGVLIYHGRIDLQVKLRGHRIELSDVEAAVRSHSAVVDAVVWVHEFKPGDQRLVCAYTAADGATPDVRELRAHVRTRLPAYMHPAGYQRLPTAHLPRTINGKVDRAEVVRIWETERNRNR